MADYSIDPIVGAEIMDLLGISPTQLDNPRTYRSIHDIVSHFASRPDYRQVILKLLSKSFNPDKVETALNYVNLQNEKNDLLSQLNPQHFSEDIAKEIQEGHLTQQSAERVKQDIETRLNNYKVAIDKYESVNSALQTYE